MAEYREYLAMLDTDPGDHRALAGLEKLGEILATDEARGALDRAREVLKQRGAHEIVARLFDVEIAHADERRRADLLLQQGHLFVEDLLEERSGVQCFEKVLALRPDDEEAKETLEHLELVRENWTRIVDKYLAEAEAATDKELSTSMFVAAAETLARYEPDSPDVERHLRRALEVDPKSRRAAGHLERILRRQERYKELRTLLEERVDLAVDQDDRVHALLALAEVATERLDLPDLALDAMKKVIAVDPGHARALALLREHYEKEENWAQLAMLYEGALKSRRRAAAPETEIGMLIQIGMLHWKQLGNSEAAAGHFARLRKLDPAHPAALEFYRHYYTERGEEAKLTQIYRQALKNAGDEGRRKELMLELAELSETSLGSPEKAIDSWKSILRSEPKNERAREALKRLYARTEKWNALLDLMKDEVEKLPREDVEGRVAGLFQVVEIYRDRLKLDVMVINTYNAILALDPDNREALDAVAGKYKELGRWNDLISVLSRKAQRADLPEGERADILREIAGLWIDRFGNYAQAIKPLEELLELSPGDAEATARLVDIYTRRRQWRALIALMGREAEHMPLAARRARLAEMAKLAGERLGDSRLAIDIWNRVLELPGSEADPDATAADTPVVFDALAHLYEREKRYLALADIYRRQRRLAVTPDAARPVLERLGALLADRLGAPAQAAEVYQEILDIDPGHARAARTLRELYAAAGDYDALEALYSRLGHWDDLVDAFFAIAERKEDRAERLALLERAAEIASKHIDSRDKVARVYERLQSVEPKHLGAARALVPLYEQIGKWARLLATYEILLESAGDDERLSLMGDIRKLCEEKLGSKAQAFQWTARAYRLRPGDPALLADLERLGAEADAWDEVSAILDERVGSDDIEDDERLRLLRELGRIAQVRLHDAERAQRYQRRVLELRPDDEDALAALEELATQKSQWPQLLEVYRRRVELESDREAKLELLFKIAFIEEDRLRDSAAATATYRRIVDIDPGSRRALKALAKLCEAGSDWAGLAEVLERELALETDPDAQVGLHLRLGKLRETSLDQRAEALAEYKKALALAPSSAVHAALEGFLEARSDDATRLEVAALLLPAYEHADAPEKIARVLEILRGGASGDDALALDRRLIELYVRRLGDDARAYDAAARILELDADDAANRERLAQLGAALGRTGDVADRLELAYLACEEAEAEPAVLLAMAEEIAVARAALDDDAAAEEAWRRVLSLDSGNARAGAALSERLRLSERWAELRALLEQRIEHSLDAGERVRLLIEVADLSEQRLGDAGGAIAAFVRVLDVDPAHAGAAGELERLYQAAARYAELEELLARRGDHAEDEAERDRLSLRRARLRVGELGDATGALDLAEEILARDPGQPDARALVEGLITDSALRGRVARLLAPIYEAEGLWRDLVRALRIEAELSETPRERADLLARIAGLEEERLGQDESAFATWVEALACEPGDEGARAALSRLGGALHRWDEVAAAFERAADAVDAADVAARTQLLAQLAAICDGDLGDPERATSAYQRLLDADPTSPEIVRRAAAALDRLHGAAGDHRQQITAIRRRAEWADDAAERRDLLARVAEIEEGALADADAAVTTWREILAEDADDPRALDALERLLAAQGQTRELAEIIRRRVELAPDEGERKAQLQRLARLAERELEDRQEAIAALLEILDFLPTDDETFAELARLYAVEERHADLLDILERRLVLAEAEHRIALTFEAAELLSGELSRPAEALEHHALILAADPQHTASRSRVEGFLDDPELRGRAAEILLPLYEEAGLHAELASLLERMAEAAVDPRTQVEHLRRVAALREHMLDDGAGAFAATRRALAAALSEPELPDILADLQRQAAAQGRLDELIDIYIEVAPDVFDADLQRRLTLDIADLARAVRHDDQLAREHYQRVLDAQPDDRRALTALEGLYRDAGDHQRLFEVLSRKADLAGADLDARAGALKEAARLCDGDLDRTDEAIMLWEQVLELTPDDREAASNLEDIYTRGKRWHDLTDLFERRLGFAFTVEEAVDLRFRLGRIYEDELLDPDSAVESYAAALGGDPGHAGSAAALERLLDDAGTRGAAAEVLEPIYVARQDWPKLVRIYEIKLEAADDPAERRALTRYIARLYEDQLEDLEGAFRWYGRVFRETPADRSVRAQLVRLANVLQNWGELANVYQEYLDDETSDAPEVAEVAAALADICDRRTGEIERAHAAYRRVLQAREGDVQTFARLRDMLTRAERWFALVGAYEEVVHATLDDARRVSIYLELARLQEQRLGDAARAVDALRAALEIDPDNQSAIAELDRLLEDQKSWHELADLLSAQIERTDDPRQQSDLRMRLAGLREQRMSDVAGAIDVYETVLESEGGEVALPHLERLVVLPEHRERIAALLEPVYRAQDWWQKLVVILAAQLEFVSDPPRRVEMLREIAGIHETRGGDLGLALDAIGKAWLEEPTDMAVYEHFTALGTRLGAWQQLVDTYEAGISDQYDEELIATVLLETARIHEQERADRDAAIAALRRLLQTTDDHPRALAELDRLLEDGERWGELVKIVERRAELSMEPAVRAVLLRRAAQVTDERLGDRGAAIDRWQNALAVEDGDADTLAALDRLLAAEERWPDLAQILLRRIELAAEPEDRRALRLRAAELYEQKLSDGFEAVSQLRAILDEDPSDAEALERVGRLYERESNWTELIEVLDRRAELATDARERADLAFTAAGVVERELMDPDAAIARYASVLDLSPEHTGARGALDAMTQNEDTLVGAAEVLERVYWREGAHDELATLMERRLAAESTDPDERRALLSALAELHEMSRGDVGAAFSTWARALAEFPEDEAAQGQLERLAGDAGSWRELAALYEERLASTLDAQLELHFASKLARLYEESLGDLGRAAESLRRALPVADDPAPVLESLARVLDRDGRHEDLAEVLARQAEATLDDAEQADFLFRLGDLREQRLGDPAGAVSAYRDVLDRSPRHPAARSALERLLATSERQRADIIAILEPLYDSEGEAAQLAHLLSTKLTVTGDSFERAQLYARIAELAEKRLGDPTRALDAVGGWLAEDPQSEEALGELERLGAIEDRWSEVAARLGGIAASTDDTDVRRRLCGRLGAVQLDRLGDLAAAETTYRTVLDLDPEAGEALEALERIYRQQQNAAALAEVLARRGEIVYDAQVKRDCFAEVGRLREQLGEPDAAVDFWRQVLELDEGDREAHDHLARLHEQRGDWEALIGVLSTASRHAPDRDADRELRTRIAGLLTSAIGDEERAIDAWQSVLDLDPAAADAFDALEGIHRGRGDWLAVQEILSRRLEVSPEPDDKIAILLRMAQAAEIERQAPEEAVDFLRQILDLEAGHDGAFVELSRLLAQVERHHELVELFERRAEIAAARGDLRGEIDLLARAADVWEGPLDSPDAAGELLEKILEREPTYVPALTRLAKIYEGAGDWDRCGEILERALALGPTGHDAADLYVRLGEVARAKSGDEEAAQQHFSQALQFDPHHEHAVRAVEEAARERGDFSVVADMLQRRFDGSRDQAVRRDLAIELADIYTDKLGYGQAVIPLLEAVATEAPEDARVLAPLADLYLGAGRHAEAQPLFERLAAEAKKKRRMKDVARYRQRLGDIFAASGDSESALAAYEEAFRVDPTNVATMAGLGRLYLERQEWDKARRVYRSLVLQNIDPRVGLSKADVYYNLGHIHMQLGESAKAKGMFQRGLEIEPEHPNLRQALESV